MSKLNDYFEYRISGHFLSAIINDDYSGLNDEEINLLEIFLTVSDCLTGSENAVWDIDSDSEPHFIDCDVTGLFSNCHDVKLHFHNSSIETEIRQ